jgi:isopentenyl diphosphate isomerase/L-lactate dehydrogenase-like FMN-dependent dehydrogenase
VIHDETFAMPGKAAPVSQPLIGRPYAYGLALGGEAGVTHVLRALRQDFELTMQLSGYARLDELDPHALTRRAG